MLRTSNPPFRFADRPMPEDLTEGSVLQRVIALAWPTAVAMSMQTGFNIADAYFVGQIGPQSIAAVSMVFPVVFLMFALGAGVGVGTTSVIARSLGRRDREHAEEAARQSFILFALVAALITVTGLLLQRPLFHLMGADDALVEHTVGYSTWIFAGSTFMFFFFSGASILRGEGDMKTPMVGIGLSVVLNVVLDPLLIFGPGPFPEFGLPGAAIATVISRAVGCVFLIGYLFRGDVHVRVRLRGLAPRGRVIWQILQVGLPTGARQVLLSVGFMALIRIVARFGSDAVAAYGLGVRLNQVAILPCLGIATAVITLVGQNVGAGKTDRASETTWKASLCAMVAMEAIGVTFFLFPRFLMGIFTDDAQVIRYGSSLLRIVSLTHMFTGLGIVIAAAFQGAGRALPALALTLLRLLIIAVPLALLLSHFYGVRGVWMAIAAAAVLSGIASAAWFRAGTWRPDRRDLHQERQGIS